jgi:16S rRNA (guanine966-N2)-methyltransferase
MRVVGGKFGGRTLKAPQSQAIRPTSDRLRESLFNILAHSYADHLDNTRVLDLFAGTGALGIEALSRGARFCLFVEQGTEARGLVRDNIEALGLTGVTKLFKRDAISLGPAGTVEALDLVLCDPPYGKKLAEAALKSAQDGGWLKDGALVVIEEEKSVTLDLPPAFSLLDRREAGAGALHFFKFNAG